MRGLYGRRGTKLTWLPAAFLNGQENKKLRSIGMKKGMVLEGIVEKTEFPNKGIVFFFF